MEESGEYKNRHRSSVGLLFLESVLFFIWPNQLSSGTIRILEKGLNYSGIRNITILKNISNFDRLESMRYHMLGSVCCCILVLY